MLDSLDWEREGGEAGLQVLVGTVGSFTNIFM